VNLAAIILATCLAFRAQKRTLFVFFSFFFFFLSVAAVDVLSIFSLALMVSTRRKKIKTTNDAKVQATALSLSHSRHRDAMVC